MIRTLMLVAALAVAFPAPASAGWGMWQPVFDWIETTFPPRDMTRPCALYWSEGLVCGGDGGFGYRLIPDGSEPGVGGAEPAGAEPAGADAGNGDAGQDGGDNGGPSGGMGGMAGGD